MIDKETIDRIFDAARIEEVVGEFVTLKRRGANMMGLCPFHNEKTPSFTVSPAKGIYKCFGCSKGGNSVNFIMDHEQLSYPEALRWLAKKYHIEIPEVEQSPEQLEAQNERESLFIVSGYAQKYFTENLHSSDEGKAIGLSYFKERGFRPEIIEKFQLGYSLEKRSSLVEAAKAAGYKLEYMTKAGIISTNDEGKSYYDRFAGRVMFPIHNVTGRVIAFGGRTLRTDKKVAKYVNSPETDIYHKSKVLYGIFFAKKAIIAEDNAFLVEGYTDVISLHQAGIENVVASSGTSLTVDQIRLIRRYTNNITILYDGDFAGIKASLRGIDLVLEEGMNVKVLLFPDGEDPDSFSKKVSTEELKRFIKENSADFIVFKTNLLMKDVAGDPIKKAGLIREIVESIALIPEAITRSVYIKECSHLMGIEEQVLLTELNKFRRKKLSEKAERRDDGQREQSIGDQAMHMPESEMQVDIRPSASAIDATPQEHDIVRILLNYGRQEVTVEGEDEEGNAVDVPITVTELIIHELSQDNIVFDDPTYSEIYFGFVKGAQSGNIPDEMQFVNHPEKKVRDITIDILSFPYSISEKWEEHGIFTNMEAGMLKKTVLSSIYSLKVKKLEVMRVSIHEEIKASHEAGKDITELLMKLQALEEAKKQFNQLLGRIIIR
jgi:DNA primase